jgi:hypothetical protein
MGEGRVGGVEEVEIVEIVEFGFSQPSTLNPQLSSLNGP